MKSRTLKILPMAIGLVLIVVSISWARDPISHRQMRQSQRITHGIRSGEVTDREFVRMNREQRRIGKYKRRARRDGRISHRERRCLHRMQDRAGGHRPVYHGYCVSGTFFEPSWSFGWSMGWR
jgi:Sec7-like guanine-nucleotide exchange factor